MPPKMSETTNNTSATKKDDFREAYGRSGNASKGKQTGNESDYEKRYCELQHVRCPALSFGLIVQGQKSPCAKSIRMSVVRARSLPGSFTCVTLRLDSQ
jgi:hypothetical protein